LKGNVQEKMKRLKMKAVEEKRKLVGNHDDFVIASPRFRRMTEKGKPVRGGGVSGSEICWSCSSLLPKFLNDTLVA
jgi:hypothetical protein